MHVIITFVHGRQQRRGKSRRLLRPSWKIKEIIPCRGPFYPLWSLFSQCGGDFLLFRSHAFSPHRGPFFFLCGECFRLVDGPLTIISAGTHPFAPIE